MQRYIKYSFITNTIVSIENTLAMTNMLSTVSTFDNEIVRSFSYISKDIIGQVSSAVYLLYTKGKIDKNPRSILLISNILQQSAYISMSLCHLYPTKFIFITGISSILFNISFILQGAINTKCIQRLSENNIGEIYTHVAVINTLASSLGISFGMMLLWLFPSRTIRCFFIPMLGIARIYTYKKACENLIYI